MRDILYYQAVSDQLGVKGVSLSHQDNLDIKVQGASDHLSAVHAHSL